MSTFLIVSGRQTALRIAVPTLGALRLGSDPSCDVVVREPGIHPLHVELYLGPRLGARALGPEVAVETAAGDRAVSRDASVELGPGERLRVGPIEVHLGTALPVVETQPRQLDAMPGANRGPRARSADPSMEIVDRLIEQAARGEEPVLVLGETGVGKDDAVRRIHEGSTRAFGPLEVVHAIELGESGLPAELLSASAHGTLVLDEVSALSERGQIALAHDLERCAARVVATSNRDLDDAVRQGTFRKDLFYRLARLRIEIPPLRDRPGDIAPLASAFATRAGVREGFAAAALEALSSYPWPGNLRELDSVIQRAAVASGGGRIQVEHLPAEVRLSMSMPSIQSGTGDIEATALGEEAPKLGLREEMAALERRRILEALNAHPTQTEAAKELGIPLRTFLNRMDALGIPRARKK